MVIPLIFQQKNGPKKGGGKEGVKEEGVRAVRQTDRQTVHRCKILQLFLPIEQDEKDAHPTSPADDGQSQRSLLEPTDHRNPIDRPMVIQEHTLQPDQPSTIQPNLLEQDCYGISLRLPEGNIKKQAKIS